MKLAIIATHPIQYYAPWFQFLSAIESLEVCVFYLWDFGITEKLDPGFGRSFQWDIPLLEGYRYEFVENVSTSPGTHHYGGLHNPDLIERVEEFDPACVLLMAYKYKSTIDFLSNWKMRRKTPVLFRGDSHRLKPKKSIRSCLKRIGLSLFYRYFIDACLYVGKANKSYYEIHSAKPEQLFFSPHAIDRERFLSQERIGEEAMLWRRELGIPDENTVILFLGKFEKKKHPLDLLESYLALQPQNASLLFVGDGSFQEQLSSRANEHPDVFVAPFQNQSEIPRTLAACDVLVLPSDEGETWGLVVNEAMCLGKPAIVSDLVGCGPDLVIPGETGLVFPCRDVLALTESLREALSDRERLKEWGNSARVHSEQYSYERASQGVLEAIDYCLSRSK